MADSVSLKLLPQFVETMDEVFEGRRLHKIQQALLHYDELPEFTVITAPTGTGKSFAFPLPIIQHRKTGSSFSKRRCIIVSPTSALIEDMAKEYAKIFVSSAESVGNFRFGKTPHCMKQGYFKHFIVFKTVGFSRYEIYFTI